MSHVTQIDMFLSETHAHGLPVELFGAKSNARNFINWQFAPASDPLPQTVCVGCVHMAYQCVSSDSHKCFHTGVFVLKCVMHPQSMYVYTYLCTYIYRSECFDVERNGTKMLGLVFCV